jgi:hypothetical protein
MNTKEFSTDLKSEVWWLKPAILATQEVGIRELLWFKANLGKMFLRPHLHQWLFAVAQACHLFYAGTHK